MKLLICDDTESLCLYYKMIFSKCDDIDVVGTAYNGHECKELVRANRPDVLLLDIQMRTNDEGICIIEELLKIMPELKIIMFTVHKIDEYVFRAFAAGAKSFICKTASDDEIIESVRDVYNNKLKLDSDIGNVLARKSREVMNKQKSLFYVINQITKLSKSELNVLRGVYYGKTYREIATERFVEEGTIRAQISGILKKTESKSINELIKGLRDMDLFEFIDLYSNENT